MRPSRLIISLGVVVGLLAAAAAARPATKPADKKDPPAAKPAPPAGDLTVTVKEVKGKAQKLVVKDDKETWAALKVGEKLDEETIVRTGFSSRVVLQFADNSTVTIRSATKMGIAQFRKEGAVTKTQLGLKYGSVRAKVHKARGPNDFTVSSPVATLAITGSDGDAGFCGDSGFKSTCDTGGFTVYKGFQVRALSGGESTNNDLAMSSNVNLGRFAAGIAVTGVTKNEKLSMITQGDGRTGIASTGGGLGIRQIVKPPPPPSRPTVIVPALDIGIGD